MAGIGRYNTWLYAKFEVIEIYQGFNLSIISSSPFDSTPSYSYRAARRDLTELSSSRYSPAGPPCTGQQRKAGLRLRESGGKIPATYHNPFSASLYSYTQRRDENNAGATYIVILCELRSETEQSKDGG